MFGRTVAPTRAMVPAACNAHQPRQHRSLGHAKRRGDHRKRLRHQRQIALKLVQQTVVRAGKRSIYNPVRCARAVKKMPEGLAAATSPSSAKVRVS